MWLSTGPGGLLLPFDPPELTIAAAIGRGWAIPDGGALLLPLPPAFLPTRGVGHPGVRETSEIA